MDHVNPANLRLLEGSFLTGFLYRLSFSRSARLSPATSGDAQLGLKRNALRIELPAFCLILDVILPARAIAASALGFALGAESADAV
jgi:hypothetical protein